MKTIFFFLLFFNMAAYAYQLEVPSESEARDFLENIPNATNPCEFYQKLHEVSTCRPKDYPLGFGKFFCELFSKEGYPHLTSQGKDWFIQTQICLIEAAANAVDEGHTQCRKLTRDSVNSHFGCYLNAGFCDLPHKDIAKMSQLVGRKNLTPSMLWLVLRLKLRCLVER